MTLSRYYDTKLPKSRIDELKLGSGSHPSRSDGVCATEAIAWMAGEAHSDKPACLCPTLGSFLRNWNDSLPDEDRARLIRPLLLPAMMAPVSPKATERRSWISLDWLVRVHAVAWLRAAKLDEHADALATMPEIVSLETLDVDTIHQAGDAAGDAARDAAWAAAWAAAWDAARDAAGAAAWAAAGAAAWDAARDAAGAELDPTKRKLQQSAQKLVRRMCEVTA